MIMIAVALLLSMVLCLLFGVPYIDFLKKKTIGQYVLDLAPEAHAKKQGTPTTGGVFIILAIIISSIITLLMAEKMDNSAWIILITLFFMALAGFQDDYLNGIFCCIIVPGIFCCFKNRSAVGAAFGIYINLAHTIRAFFCCWRFIFFILLP